MPTVRVIVGGLVCVLLLAVCSEMNYQDELREQQQYCSDVEKGIIPDYEDSYGEWCKKPLQ